MEAIEQKSKVVDERLPRCSRKKISYLSGPQKAKMHLVEIK